MKYTIVGTDGKTYGPADGAQIIQWLGQRRVESRTPVFVEGASEWTFLGLLPEFAAHFSGPPPVIRAFNGAASQPAQTNTLAVWGLVCGILAWVLCCCFPFSVLGLVFSIVALTQIQASAGAQEGRGLAIAGIVLSGLHLLWCLGCTALNLATDNQDFMWRLGQN